MKAADELIAEAVEAPIRGWDFSWLKGRAEETQPPWDYGAIVREAAANSHSLLDIDTGGGEFLARLAPISGMVVATEGYAPNVGIARERLTPLGIHMLETTSAPDNVDQIETSPSGSRSELPFASNVFDLVINRQSSFWPSEIYRVLRQDGRFVTQQRSEAGTSGTSWEGLFDRPTQARQRFDKAFAIGQLGAVGFDITQAEEADTPMRFWDVGAVVYYLRMVPWAAKGFNPTDDRQALEHIHELIMNAGALEIRGSHMLLDARRR